MELRYTSTLNFTLQFSNYEVGNTLIYRFVLYTTNKHKVTYILYRTLMY